MLNADNLHQPGNYYKDLLDQLHQGYILMEVLFNQHNEPFDIRYIEANNAARRIINIEQAEQTETWLKTSHLQQLYGMFGRVATTGISEEREISISPSDTYYRFQALKVGGHNERKIAVLYEDITERKPNNKEWISANNEISERKLASAELHQLRLKLEEEVAERTAELDKNRTLLQATLDSNLEMIQVFKAVRDDHGKIIDFVWILNNNASAQIYGDVIGQSLLKNNPGVVAMGIFDNFVSVTETGVAQQYEKHYRYEQFDGWFYQSAVKLNDGVATTTINITGRKQAEQERFKNYLLLQQSEELAMLGSWDHDLLNGVFTWSHGLYRLFDIEIGKKVEPEIYLEYATEASRSAAERIVEHIRSGAADMEEVLQVKVSGKLKVIRLKAVVIRNNSGTAIRVLGVDMDISAIRAAEEKIGGMEAEKQQEVFRAVLHTQEEERRHISESLHNGIGQLLYGVKISMSDFKWGMSEEEFEQTRRYTNTLLTDAIKETRRVSHDLMPATLEEFGLRSAVEDICKQLSNGVKFKCKISGPKERLEKYLELAVYRTIQELMINVVKHAHATSAMIDVLVTAGQIRIKVSDNGGGMPPKGDQKPGIGLASIRSKVKLLSGDINIETATGKGTIVEVVIPMEK